MRKITEGISRKKFISTSRFSQPNSNKSYRCRRRGGGRCGRCGRLSKGKKTFCYLFLKLHRNFSLKQIMRENFKIDLLFKFISTQSTRFSTTVVEGVVLVVVVDGVVLDGGIMVVC